VNLKTEDYGDLVVIGTGLGGASLACRLAERGQRVTLVERGAWPRRDECDWDPRRIMVEKIYKSDSPVRVAQYGRKPKDMYYNEVVGGMSVFYGGAALRFREEDFRGWPIGYAELEPYYGQAERLLEVHGVADDPTAPWRSSEYPYPARELSRPAQRIFEAARALGLNPCHLPLALNQKNKKRPLCENCHTCDGFPCKLSAKNEAVTSAILSADPNRLRVLDRTLALHLELRGKMVEAVVCLDLRTQEVIRLKAKRFVVSAGALQSPALLLRSGLGEQDRSGQLGRNLMRHCNAIVGCLFPFRVNPEKTNHKQVLVSSLYHAERKKTGLSLGVIQDMCMPPPLAVKLNAPRGLGTLAGSFSNFIQALLCIAEDVPQPSNRVTLSTEKDGFGVPLTEVYHNYHQSDLVRRNRLVKIAKRILYRAGGLFCVTTRISTFSHGLGTARFGSDPSTSVLDPYCRFWACENLYVVDSCFMPTSGGVNPSLTIVANALRVADHLSTQETGPSCGE